MKNSVFQRSRKEVENAWSGDWDKWKWEYWAQFLQFKGKQNTFIFHINYLLCILIHEYV